MTVNDRFTRGFLSGIVAGLVNNAITLTSYYFNINQLRWLDWASLLVFNRRPGNVIETIITYGLQLMFSGILGILFAYLTRIIGSTNYYLKAVIFGLGSWFMLFVIVHLLKVPGLINQTVGTVLTDIFAIFIWGLVLAHFMIRLDRKTHS